MRTWHIYYRTLGMQEEAVAGWKRSDRLAATAEDAMRQFMDGSYNVFYARVYPGSAALAFSVEWVRVPEIEIEHRPHDEEE